MILQGGKSAAIWGWAGAGEKVTLGTSWGAKATAVAAADGRWRANIKLTRQPGPHFLDIRAGEDVVTIQDVLIGDVWLCSGQSNMAWRLADSGPRYADFIQNYGNSTLRQFEVAKVMTTTPQEVCEGKWVIASPQTLGSFTAVGALFAARLRQELGNIPVGLINSSYGGTAVELWTSEPSLAKVPGYPAKIQSRKDAIKRKQQALIDWQAKIESMDRGRGLWSAETLDTSDWKPTSDCLFENIGMNNFDGVVWARATVDLPNYSGDAILDLGPVDDEDATYVNGTLVGSKSVWNEERQYAVPQGLLHPGRNSVVVRITDRQLGGGFLVTPERPRLILHGQNMKLVDWRIKIGANFAEAPPMPYGPDHGAAELYNAMIHPIAGYNIRGALWYQGEANVNYASSYADVFRTMVNSWRQEWNQGNFPFYAVQIAPFTYGDNFLSGELREQQQVGISQLTNAFLVPTVDEAERVNDIHPKNKWLVGSRLGNVALSTIYRVKNLPFLAPTFAKTKSEGSAIRIEFKGAKGLNSQGLPLTGFVARTPGGNWQPADAKIEGDTVVVSLPNGIPVQDVRYAWGSADTACLWNAAGMPVMPFRTDKDPYASAKNSWQ